MPDRAPWLNSSSPDGGLSAGEARRRLALHGPNEIDATERRGLLRRTENGNPQTYISGVLAGVVLIVLAVVVLT